MLVDKWNEGIRDTYKQVAGVVGVAIMGFTVEVGTHKCFSFTRFRCGKKFSYNERTLFAVLIIIYR